ncbi:hypothetical protein CLCR_09225 [Cladophialophora carrionii]|uniref:Uncharacterized protein n=1 Tax=Cladophialophora carrionii TaxID=86049 RepID=A0A1C1CTN6_9EURO|nr:hypothetical protein CLCR_09225 [Cladophialophora carrionii]
MSSRREGRGHSRDRGVRRGRSQCMGFETARSGMEIKRQIYDAGRRTRVLERMRHGQRTVSQSFEQATIGELVVEGVRSFISSPFSWELPTDSLQFQTG